MIRDSRPPNLSSKDELHAAGWNGDGRTLCGVVDEGDASIGLERPVVATRGHAISCKDCRAIIRYAHVGFKVSGALIYAK
jgi:hypothetical protein